MKKLLLEEFQTKRTVLLSEMLDNPDKLGIYQTTKFFNELDELFIKMLDDFESGLAKENK
jgi:hypothetical protein